MKLDKYIERLEKLIGVTKSQSYKEERTELLGWLKELQEYRKVTCEKCKYGYENRLPVLDPFVCSLTGYTKKARDHCAKGALKDEISRKTYI